MSSPRLRLGQLLIDAKLISAEALDEVLALQRRDGRRLGTILVERGLINETQLTQILSHQLAVPWVSLLHVEFTRQLLNLVPREVADRYCLVPIYVRRVRNQGDTLYIAMEDPTNEEGLTACREYSGLPVRAMIAPPSDIRSAIRVYYGVEDATSVAPPVKRASAPAPPPADKANSYPPTDPNPSAADLTRAEDATDREEGDVLDGGSVAADGSAVTDANVEDAPPVARSESAPDTTKDGSRTDDGPQIEAVEISVEQRRGERLRAILSSEPSPPSSPAVDAIPHPRGRTPRMVALTLLDGTTIALPARNSRRAPVSDPPRPDPATQDSRRSPSEPPSADDLQALTTRDLIHALRAVADGADASEILGSNVRWESLMAATLSILLKKHLIADWEFVDELKRHV